MSSPQRGVYSGTATKYPGLQRIYEEWDRALSHNDPQALLALYAPDATLESPLLPHLLGTKDGILRGHAELTPFFDVSAKRKPAVRRYYRTAFLTDGKNNDVGVPVQQPRG